MRKNRSFTLIELLIASSIFIVIMLTISISFHTGMFGYRNIEDTLNIHQTASRTLERINLDLRNSFCYSADEAKFKGEKNEISFLSLVNAFRQNDIGQDYAFVSYYLEEKKLMRLCRRNQEALNDKSEIKPRILASDIEEIVFSYGYINPQNQSMEWKDEWNEPNVLPVAIKVKLTIKYRAKQDFERTVFLPLG